MNIPKPNRVLADKPLQGGMIIPGTVVIQSSPVVFPARVREGVGGCSTCRGRLAKGLVGVLTLHQSSTSRDRTGMAFVGNNQAIAKNDAALGKRGDV
jgi:hypothetical protein